MSFLRHCCGVAAKFRPERWACSAFRGVVLCCLLASCTQNIDYENDVRQRAKTVSQKEMEAIRQGLNSEKAREKYRTYKKGETKQSLKKKLTQLEKEKREIERKLALMTYGQKSGICPLCQKANHIKATKKKYVARKKTKKKTPVKKKNVQQVGTAVEKMMPPSAPVPLPENEVPQESPVPMEMIPQPVPQFQQVPQVPQVIIPQNGFPAINGNGVFIPPQGY